MIRRSIVCLSLFVVWGSLFASTDVAFTQTTRPNILFAIADDWGWPHAGAYGDQVVITPNFDRLAQEGVLFNHAYISSPSCTPSRGAILTGQWHWRLEGAANLFSVFPDRFNTYPELLAAAGYETGVSGKGWGPGRTESAGRQLCGKPAGSFQKFLAERKAEKPFCYWLGTSDPHRPYKKGAGAAAGMDLDRVHLFGCFPDATEVRGDVADYYFEVQRFDALVGTAIESLENIGELDNTIIVMTGDHGMPFPRCKSNNYDSGARVPLAIRGPGVESPGRAIDDFVSLTDLAPTFLAAAGVDVPVDMTGRQLQPIFASEREGVVTADRDHVLHGKERHVPGQEAPNMGGYPCRAIRTHDFLYIRNFDPDRWPAGTPNYERAAIPGAWLADCDNGPTKSYIVDNRDKDDAHRRAYDLCFGKRPAEELYDLKNDPEQLENVAGKAEYAEARTELSKTLTAQLKATGDPRVIGGGEKFDEFPYLGGAPKFPKRN
jgi:N-sulfoglucosamine sulfohydrolase